MPTHTNIEREAKFAVGRAFDLPDVGDVVGRSARQPDTPGRRLWSQGITLRYRSVTDGARARGR